ncbi:nitrous oxide reductase family maturation protein NosD [Sulfurovum sp.]|uniref:nitrous oxide reductase family maturation protein NosD n=1 Tax=Sulfurovum sp. TaxID=1969726 RepID=UPI0025FEA82F|nr:nitrous oxide reductase family maturation protein NosD [Sulfurovum sp.]
MIQKSLIFFLSGLFFTVCPVYANVLQDAIDRTAPYATITLAAGTYRGNISIDKPLTLRGKEPGVIIQGDKQGNVISITGSQVTLDNLIVTDSGTRMTTLDAAITMKQADHCHVTKCTIRNSLYGINMQSVRDSNITYNFITSNGNPVPLRGNALKVWNSSRIEIRNNTVEKSRDITLAFSQEILFSGNSISQSRHGLAIERSRRTTIENNHFAYNATGIMLEASQETNISDNEILSCRGVAGIAVVIQGGGSVRFIHNKVSFNAKAFYIDTKGHEKGMKRYFRNNTISYNKEAFHFHSTIRNNTMTGNRIFGNIDDVVKDIKGTGNGENRIAYNYWDRYEGFDKNGDNIGDTPYRIYQYADRLWQYNNKIKFFYASPVMSLMNFIAQLAPFIEPNLLLEDTKPIVHMKKRF